MGRRLALWAMFLLLAAIGWGSSDFNCSLASEIADTGARLAATPPPTPLEHNKRALELAKRGRWAEAINEHEIAVAGEPSNQTFKSALSVSLIRHADVLMEKKNYQRAAELYQRALEADSDNLSAKSGLTEALKLIGKSANSN